MSEANMEQKQKHFVLVHGACMGAWCWYKLKPLLESAGSKVTAIDLAACGINTDKIEDVHSFADYSKPLLEFLATLAPNEKVVLVGHSFGGMSVALSMEKFPEKIVVGIFLAAFTPDTHHKPAYVLQQFVERCRTKGRSDSELSFHGNKTLLLLGTNFLSTNFFQLSSTEDLELVKNLRRRGSLFVEELHEAENFTKERYESVPRAYIVSNEDLAIPVEYQHWMIQNAGIDVVHVINGADHMTRLSNPSQLCSSLLDIIVKYA